MNFTSRTRRTTLLAAPGLRLADRLRHRCRAEKITLGYLDIPCLIPLYGAKEQESFDGCGLGVKWQIMPTDVLAMPPLGTTVNKSRVRFRVDALLARGMPRSPTEIAALLPH